MFTALLRVIKYGLLGFVRSGWLSTATIVIMVVALMIFEGMMVFNILTQSALETLQNKIDISAYFKSDISEDEILRVKSSIEGLAEVKQVNYISRDRALEIFKTRQQNEETISKALEELKENPLLASLDIKAHNPKDYAVINAYLNNESLKNLINKVSYAQNSLVIEKLIKIIDTAKKAGLLLATLFSFTAGLIIFNTIRLAIYSYREEIEIMRLVGASNSFIRGPYVVEGILYGLVASILSFAIIVPIVYYASPYLIYFMPDVNIWSYFVSHSIGLFFYQWLFGIGLGVISSIIAIRKYLRV